MASLPARAAKGLVFAALLAASGCATARLVGPAPATAPDPGGARVVVVEPFFENAEWRLTTRTERAQVYGVYGPQDVTVSRQVAEKAVYARVESLAAEHAAVIGAVQRLRPSWRVLSPGALPPVEGPVTLVRVVVGEAETVGSDRALKNLACAFGVVLPPLWLVLLDPVHETQRINGRLVRFDAEAPEVRARLLRYPTQPDFAVDTRGLAPLERAFGYELELEEGALASEASRDPVLVQAFAARLAAGVVAIVEERR